MDVLEQKLHALSGYELIGEKLAQRFGAALKQRDDWGLFRINPLAFGEAHDFSPRQALDLFVHGARIGLFDFMFNQLCLMCGGVEFTHTTLNAIGRGRYLCTTCQIEVGSTLDDRLEVAFSLNPAVRKLDIDPYGDPVSYQRAFFSSNMSRSTEVDDYVKKNLLGFLLVQPEGRQVLEFESEPGERVGLLSVDMHARLDFEASAGGPRQATVGFHQHGPDATLVPIGHGRVKIEIVNYRSGPVAGYLSRHTHMKEIGLGHPPVWRSFVTGKMLLNNQSFRDLFRVQTLAPDLQLNLKSLTLLFTDLKGSTELYDRTGDVYAYQVVQEHFRALADVVRRHDGAIVKTMGDAIMASFSSSKDAVAAAVEMMKAMEAVNAKVKADGHETGLKVGLHEGSALAVNAEERLDYFGQTVNIAARVQALASSGEIWITEPVLGADGVSAALQKAGLEPQRKVVALKGVGAPTPVFRLSAKG